MTTERVTPGGPDGSTTDLQLVHEDVSTLVTRLVEINIPEAPDVMLPPEDWALVKDYLSLLLNESNLPHFVGIVKKVKQKDEDTGEEREVNRRMTTEDFIRGLRDPRVHVLSFRNDADDILGYAILRDPPDGEHETWIEKLVVRNQYQNKRRTDVQQPHVGTQILEQIKDYAFGTQTFDGRDREILYTAVVMFVPNWQRTDRLFTKSGFRPLVRWQEHAEVIMGGKFVTRDTERLGLRREDWEASKLRKLLVQQQEQAAAVSDLN